MGAIALILANQVALLCTCTCNGWRLALWGEVWLGSHLQFAVRNPIGAIVIDIPLSRVRALSIALQPGASSCLLGPSLLVRARLVSVHDWGFQQDGRSVRKDSNRQPFEPPPAGMGRGALHTGTPRSSPSDVCVRTIYKHKNNFKRRKKQHT